MNKYQLSHQERVLRKRARTTIMSQVNRVRRSKWHPPLNARQMQQAVFIARQHRLVKDTVLIAAGYNPR